MGNVSLISLGRLCRLTTEGSERGAVVVGVATRATVVDTTFRAVAIDAGFDRWEIQIAR